MDKMSLAYSRNLDITLTEIMAGKSFEQSVFVGR
jgi:hypothetical protein